MKLRINIDDILAICQSTEVGSYKYLKRYFKDYYGIEFEEVVKLLKQNRFRVVARGEK